jgi:hypothetical protein
MFGFLDQPGENMLRAKSVWRYAVLSGMASVLAPFVRMGHAAPILYGDFAGPDVTYKSVTEVPTQLPGPTPANLFGPPSVSGDSLLFNPINFGVAASGGSSELQDGRLSMNIVPTVPGTAIKMISLIEGGGWTVDNGTAATIAEESLVINELFITSVNGVSVNPIVVPPTITYSDTNNGSAAVVKTPSSIEFQSAGGLSSGSWNGTANFDILGALQSAGLSGNVTGLSLDLDNQLAANSEANSESLIDKKFFEVQVTNSSVPEPVTASGLVLLSIGSLLRRPRKA